MLTREKIQRGEGELVAENPLIGLRKRASHSEKMASEEGISQDEKEFRKTFHAMSEMVKVLYEDVNVYAIIIVLCISIDKSIIRTRSLRNTHPQETQHLSWETL
jgi:hypothetical protein